MKITFCFLVAIVAGLITWAGIETKRLCVARAQLAASQELQQTIEQRLAQAHLNDAQSLVREK